MEKEMALLTLVYLTDSKKRIFKQEKPAKSWFFCLYTVVVKTISNHLHYQKHYQYHLYFFLQL